MHRRNFFNCFEAASYISGWNIPCLGDRSSRKSAAYAGVSQEPCPTRAACIVGMPNRSRGSTRQRGEVQRLSEHPVGRENHYPMA